MWEGDRKPLLQSHKPSFKIYPLESLGVAHMRSVVPPGARVDLLFFSLCDERGTTRPPLLGWDVTGLAFNSSGIKAKGDFYLPSW